MTLFPAPKVYKRTLECKAVVLAFLLASWLIPASARAQGQARDDPFAADIRPTEARTPADERKAFHLPLGFKIELFAAEPDIEKPINMAFDARGRLWVTCTIEYP